MMCGIAGVVGTEGAEREPLLRRMVASLKHRGPDEEGFYAGARAGLGMCRLAVRDPAAGHQPMESSGGRCRAVFNGEIYNYEELREFLEKKGFRFKTRCDTEVIPYLYECEGENFVARLRGMFAIALWDEQRQRLFLARDPLGIKPLYFAGLPGGGLVFGSEIKALVAALPPLETDPRAILKYFSLLYIPSPGTVYRGVEQLPPARAMVWEGGKTRVFEYWRPNWKKREWRDEREAAEKLREVLEDSVRVHLASDVPLGAFLSGGMDSSSVVAFMARHSPRPVKTFTLKLGEKGSAYDESAVARAVAKRFGADHAEMQIKPEIFSLLPEIVRHFDQPFADSSCLLTYWISAAARQKATVALTGIGGDEMFGGYPRYLGALWGKLWNGFPSGLRRGAAAAAGMFSDGRLKRFLLSAPLSGEERYLSWVRIVAESDLKPLFQPDFWRAAVPADVLDSHRAILTASRTMPLADRIFDLDWKTYLSDDLLAMADRMSMAHSLELRVPFCDTRVAEFSASLPPRFKVTPRQLKKLFKKAMRGILPAEVLSHRKQGFMFPVGEWLRTHWLGPAREFLRARAAETKDVLNPEGVERALAEHAAGRRNHGDLLFALLVYAQWRRR